MSHSITLSLTDIEDHQSVLDPYLESEIEESLLAASGNSPPLLWLAGFSRRHWGKAFDNQGYEEDSKPEEDFEDYKIYFPVAGIEEVVANLQAAKQALSEYFSENGAFDQILEDLVSTLRQADKRYLWINTYCCDFSGLYSQNLISLDCVQEILDGKPVPPENIEELFGIKIIKKGLFKSKPVQFKSKAQLDACHPEVDTGAENNLGFLAGLDPEYF